MLRKREKRAGRRRAGRQSSKAVVLSVQQLRSLCRSKEPALKEESGF